MGSEARIARRLGLPVAVGGGGADGAAQAVASLLADGVTSLVSFGICGGLDPRLRPGDLVVPEAVQAADGGRWPVDPALRARLGAGDDGVLYAGTLVDDSDGKRTLHRTTGAVAVDVESAAVARSGRPFAVLRAVCDPAGRSLPHAATVALDRHGRVQGWRVLRSLMMHPGQLGGLVTLVRDAGRARRALLRRVRALGTLA